MHFCFIIGRSLLEEGIRHTTPVGAEMTVEAWHSHHIRDPRHGHCQLTTTKISRLRALGIGHMPSRASCFGCVGAWQ